ncbi:MAG TPA: hypothetical protein PLC40_11310 [Candidatus Hydrogenedentes bacterium]|nr:hypothetical protein [Candidatus Hydrogenedentota bacterium]
MNSKLPKWIRFGISITLTSIIAGVLVFTPVLSQAINVFSNADEAPAAFAVVETDAQAPLTDHPEGRLVQGIVEDALKPNSYAHPQSASQGDAPDPETPVMTNSPDPLADGGSMFAVDMQTELDNHINYNYGVFVIPGADFRSDGYDPDGFFFNFDGGFIRGNDGYGNCLMAPVYLPQAATIEDIYATVVDNDSSDSVWIGFYRLDNYSGSVVILTSLSTSTEYANPGLGIIYSDDVPGEYAYVIYPDYSYYLGTCFNSSNIELYSLRVYYH